VKKEEKRVIFHPSAAAYRKRRLVAGRTSKKIGISNLSNVDRSTPFIFSLRS